MSGCCDPAPSSFPARLIRETPAYRWVPWRAFTEFEAAFDKACDNLNKARQKVLDDFEESRDEVVVTFRQVASDSAQRLESTGARYSPFICATAIAILMISTSMSLPRSPMDSREPRLKRRSRRVFCARLWTASAK